MLYEVITAFTSGGRMRSPFARLSSVMERTLSVSSITADRFAAMNEDSEFPVGHGVVIDRFPGCADDRALLKLV